MNDPTLITVTEAERIHAQRVRAHALRVQLHGQAGRMVKTFVLRAVVNEAGERFDSAIEAAEASGLIQNAIRRALYDGKKAGGMKWSYADGKGVRGRKQQRRGAAA